MGRHRKSMRVKKNNLQELRKLSIIIAVRFVQFLCEIAKLEWNSRLGPLIIKE